MKTLNILFLFPAFLAGCPGSGDKTTDDSSAEQYWCETLDDGDTYYIDDGGGSGSSGVIIGRFISSSSDDLHDPSMVGRLDYTLESVSSGGSPQYDKTDDGGDFQATVGEGTWRVQASKSVAGNTCTSDYEFEVVGGKTTYACVVLSCE